MKQIVKVNGRTFAPRVSPLTAQIRKGLSPVPAWGLALTICASPSLLLAAPEGGVVIGGTGAIHQTGTTTTIQQASQKMAIDWQSYNLAADERVQYIQPNASSIALNHILSNSGSTIAGRIDANGQVILVNPNGLFFTPTAVINVGGIIASGLQISSDDFMNGRYLFSEVPGSDGAVINSGTINAAVGGNVALLGRHVENSCLIAARLGSVSLGAGREAVLTFDDEGLLGVRVTQEILQGELGIDPAVANSGEIQAVGGRVLLTASTSRDLFSQVVNAGDMEQATSVVMHEDGSFSLGGGADVFNTGAIDVSSSMAEQQAGQIIVLGENVTSSGQLRADAVQGNGGEIELHAVNTTLLTRHSVTSARAETNGEGGSVKVLGERVGLFDAATVDVSGAHGGGQALIGGDLQGKNPLIRNASRTTVAPEASIHADALEQGDGGRVIVWADEYTRYYGNLSARGGTNGGNGGFAEISGKEAMVFEGDVDLSALAGAGGMLLLDPKNITISAAPTTTGMAFPGDFDRFSDFQSENTVLNNNALANRLAAFEVTLQANNDITFASDVTSAQTTGGLALLNNLTLQAGRSIILNDNVKIELTDANFTATVNDAGAVLAYRDSGAAIFSMGASSSIITNKQSESTTNKGNITITSGSFAGAIGDFTLATLNTSVTGAVDSLVASGGNVTVTNSGGSIFLNGAISTGGEGWSVTPANQDGGKGGNVTLAATNGQIIINPAASINAEGGDAGSNNKNGGNGGTIGLSADSITLSGTITASGGSKDGNGSNGLGGDVSVTVSGNLISEANIISSANGDITFNGNGSANTFILNNNITLTGSTVTLNGAGGNDQLIRGGVGTANTWTIFDFGTGADGANDGELEFGSNIDANSIKFVNIENLTGGAGQDSFIIDSGGSIDGLIDGGAGSDSLTINAAGNWTVEIGNRTTANTTNIYDIETLTANAATSNTLIGDNNSNTWSIAGNNSGTVNDWSMNVAFFNFANLTGGSGDDQFTIQSGGSVTSLNAAGGNNTITINAGGNGGAVSAGGGDDSISVAGTAASINGGNGANTIAVAAGGSVTGAINGGNGIDTITINGTAGSIAAGGSNDTIVFSGTGTVSGVIDGGGGTDTFDLTALTGAATVKLGSATTTDLDVDQIEIINANGALANTLSGPDAVNTWSITATNAGSVAGVTFSGFKNLTGGTGSDTFRLSNAGDITGQIDGNTGADRLEIANGNNTWKIIDTATNEGSVTSGGLSTAFIRVEQRQGSASGIDAIDLSALIGSTFNLNDYASFDIIIGNMSSTLVGVNANTWSIGSVLGTDNSTPTDGKNDGTVNTTRFIDFGKLTGGAGADNFTITSSGSFEGTLDGAGGVDVLAAQDSANTWNITTTDSTLAYGPTTTTFNNIETLVAAQSAADIFTIRNGVTIASIDAGNGNNVVTVDAGGTVTGAIEGGSGADTITVNGTVGSIAAGGGNDTIILGAAGAVSGVIDGGADIDALDIKALTGAATVRIGNTSTANIDLFQIEAIDANGALANTLIGDNGDNTWTINAANSGSMSGITFTGFSNLMAGTGNDTFTISASISGIDAGNGANTVTVSSGGSVANSITSGSGNDTVTVNGTVASIATGGGNDSIKLGATGTVSGVIDGGTGNDTLDIKGLLSAATVQLGDSTTANIDVHQVERIEANGAMANRLIGGNGDNTWTITGANDGTVNGVDFIDFTHLTGGNNDDDFVFDSGSSLSGTVNGGAGTNTANLAALATVNVQLGANGFSNIGQITGNDTNSTLIADNITNTWRITGNNDGDVNGIRFTNFNRLTGGSQNDTFNLNEGGALSGLITGAAGTNILNVNSTTATTVKIVTAAPDTVNNLPGTLTVYQVADFNGDSAYNHTLAGPDSATTWSITGRNSGNLNFGQIVGFRGFRNLTGGAANDVFNLSSSSVPELVTGIISGGGQTSEDVINLAGMTGAAAGVVIQLGNTSVNAVGNAINAHGVERITGNSQSTLIADDTPNRWTISGANDGDINQGTPAQVAFTDFFSLRGGSDDDDFLIRFDGMLTATIDGGDEKGADTADYSGLSVVNLNFGSTAFNGISGLEGVRGNGTNSTLNGPTPSSATDVVQWSLNGVNTGSVSHGGQTLLFEGFNYLKGGNGADTFNVTNGSLRNITDGIAGMVSGGNGTNVVNINLSGTGVVDASLNYVGGTGTDTIHFNAVSGAPYQAVYTPVVAFADPGNGANAGPFEQLSYRYTDAGKGIDNGLVLNFKNADAVHSSQRVETFTILGDSNNSAVETIALSAGTFAVDGRTVVNFSDVTNMAIDGRGGADTILLNSPNVAGALTLSAESVIDLPGSILSANTVVLDGVDQFGTADNAIETSIDQLKLADAGAVYIDESSDLMISSTGDVTNTGVFLIDGITSIDAGGGSLTLSNAANDFDTVNVTNATSVSLHDSDEIAGGDMRAGSIALATVNGVGSLAAPLQTHTTQLTISNALDGGVYVNNSQALRVSIENAGDIKLENAGDIVIGVIGGVGAAAAIAAGRAPEAPGAGHITLVTTGRGGVSAGASHFATEAPDIISENLTVTIEGGIGLPNRDMSIRVREKFFYLGEQGYVYFYGGRPDVVEDGNSLVVFTGLTGISNQQLIKIESLSELDPGIFTEVRNYYYGDIAIYLPEDQRFDDENHE